MIFIFKMLIFSEIKIEKFCEAVLVSPADTADLRRAFFNRRLRRLHWFSINYWFILPLMTLIYAEFLKPQIAQITLIFNELQFYSPADAADFRRALFWTADCADYTDFQ